MRKRPSTLPTIRDSVLVPAYGVVIQNTPKNSHSKFRPVPALSTAWSDQILACLLAVSRPPVLAGNCLIMAFGNSPTSKRSGSGKLPVPRREDFACKIFPVNIAVTPLADNRSNNPLTNHCIRHLYKTSHISAIDIADTAILALTVLQTGSVNSLHDLKQSGIHLFPRPGKAHGILAHFQTGCGHASRVTGLTRGEQHLAVLEAFNSLRCGRHVCTLGDTYHAISDQGCRILLI